MYKTLNPDTHIALNIGNPEGNGILVYSHKITTRLSYAFKLIFKRILRMEVLFTTDKDEFINHTRAKISYTKLPLSDELFIHNSSLLFEQGIRDVEFKVHDWQGVPAFFTVGEQSAVPYDIFAAAFFLTSRYEEYYPQVRDPHLRYDATNSSGFQNKFLEIPVVDIWAYRILDLLQSKFPECKFPEKKYQNISTINVNEAYAFQHKGFFRNSIGFFDDLLHLNFQQIKNRFLVLSRLKNDPYDVYHEIIQWSKKHKTKTIFFFLFSEYNTFDKNVSFSNLAYKMQIKSVIDYLPFGQLFSYFTMKNPAKLIKEKNRLENVVIRPINKSRQHYNRLEIPKTYQTLIDNDIREEYSMGYNTHLGFRAGTCSPYYFFDLEFEIQTPLKIFPYCVTDELLVKQFENEPLEALKKIKQLQNEVHKVNGTFISIFHNAVVSHPQWMEIYQKIF